MSSVSILNKNLKKGKVYRREDLTHYSNAIDRHLAELVGSVTINKK